MKSLKHKSLLSLSVVILLLVSLFGAAGAQGESPTETETPTVTATATVTPTTDPEDRPGSKFFTHPVVKLLDAYFGKSFQTLPATPTPTVDPLITPDPLATPEPVEDSSGLTPVGEEIAAYHEAGMGFGQLVKIYAMAQASQEACAAQQPSDDPNAEPCVPVTVQELVDQVQSGVGMGQLFKEYGKPAMTGVGHVRKEVKRHQDDPAVVATPTAPASTGVDPQPTQQDDSASGSYDQDEDKDKDKDKGKDKDKDHGKPDKDKHKDKNKGKGNK